MRRLLLTTLLLALPAFAQDGEEIIAGKGRPGETPQEAMKKFSVAPGLRTDLWASEPLLQNPVAFSFDHRGRAFVAETFRRRTSAPDIRANMEWLLPDLALRTVAEREAFLKKTLAPELHLKPGKNRADLNGDGQFDWRDWAVESERIKLVEDTTGSGVANASSVFAEGFAGLTTGTAAGVLAYGDELRYTAIPDVWRISVTGEKEKLLTGFGVHVAYGGHDMHGIKLGPDGRIYWSIADAGAHVTTKEGTVIANPDSGAVFRAEPDGSHMELFAYGLRNPQSLAFNDAGDLFTGDNNADGGDKARWEHVVEGGDYGWRIGWQFLPKLGAWNSEKLWEMDAGVTALSLLPPTGLLGHGPAGVAYYPGTGLPDSYRDHFLMADFPGGVRAFTLVRHGASYRVKLPPEIQLDNRPNVIEGKLLWGLSPSDVQFGVDGGAYVLDWVRGWEKTGQGRIWRVHNEAIDRSAPVLEVKKLLGEGMLKRSPEELVRLLGHVDQRVRTEAQFALVAAKDVAELAAAAQGHRQPLARLHAIWGLGQLARVDGSAYAPIVAVLLDADAEVRAQAAKILGESAQTGEVPRLLPLLNDPEPRVRFFAAQALGKLRRPEAVGPLTDFLRAGVAGDPYLRHVGALALSQCAETASLTTLMRDPSDEVRTGVLLALRRQHRPEVAVFLHDWNPQLVVEAARAIHDEPIAEAMPELAAWAALPNLPAPLSRRAINAAYRIGNDKAARDLAALAGLASAPEASRLDALEALTHWNTDLGRDRVLGLYRPLPAGRKAGGAVSAATPALTEAWLKDPLPSIRLTATELAGGLHLLSAEPLLMAAAQDDSAPANLRAASLRALAALPSAKLPEALTSALQAKDAALVKEARTLASKSSPAAALDQVRAGLKSGRPAELQGAFQTLGDLPGTEADGLLLHWVGQLSTGKVPPAAQLELLEAAAKRADPQLKTKLAAYYAARSPDDPLARWGECLEGGDAQLGRQIFAEKAEAACMRCHKFAGLGGDVGPDLAGIGQRHDRKYILTSIVLPNADIAPGYENVLLTLKDGNMSVGIKSAETAESITLQPLTGGPKETVPKASIAKQDKVPSPMPEGLGEVLGKRDLRNVVEFLTTSDK